MEHGIWSQMIYDESFMTVWAAATSQWYDWIHKNFPSFSPRNFITNNGFEKPIKKSTGCMDVENWKQ